MTAPHPADAGAPGSGVQRYEPTMSGVAAPSQVNESASAALSARVKAEVEARTIVALRRPRDINNFRVRLLEACRRTRFADAARYSKPLGGQKTAEGFSIRFAEEVARHYGNVDISTSVISESAEMRVLEVVAVDLEVNLRYAIAVPVEKVVERRSPRQGEEVISWRVNSSGNRVALIAANEDQTFVKQQAMLAKARRELILSLVPSDIKEEAEDAIAETLSAEEAQDPKAARKRVIDVFFKYGVMPAEVEEYLGHSLEQTSPAELNVLRKLAQALAQGEASWPEIMETKRPSKKPAAEGEPASEAPAKKGGAAGLKAAVKGATNA